MSIHVRIDRVVVDGLPLAAGDAASLHAAMEAELAERLRGDAGVAARIAGGAESRVALALDGAPDAGPDTLGRSVARTLHSGVFR